MLSKPHHVLAIGFAGIFLLLISPVFLTEGLFMDGAIYAAIAKNMANGLGHFWSPHFTQTLDPSFQQHPPLALWLGSLFFSLLGNGFYTEKIYSAFTFCITGYFIVKIWRLLVKEEGYEWLPLTLWGTTPLVFWAVGNNILENSLMMFTTTSVWLYWQGRGKKWAYFSVLGAGILLSFAFLCKGFVAFFPWTLPVFYAFFQKEKSYSKTLGEVSLFVLGSLVPLLLLYLLIPDAKIAWQAYWQKQMVNSLKNVQTVSSRFFIIGKMLTELAFPILLSIALGWFQRKKMGTFTLDKNALILLFLALCGVLPICISLKQSGFYILATFPFFALAFALQNFEIIKAKIESVQAGILRFRLIAYLLLLTGIAANIFSAGKIGRDKNKLEDMKLILAEVPANSLISICPEMEEDWGLHAYYQRYKNISLQRDFQQKEAFFLSYKNCISPEITSEYEKVPLASKEYELYRRK